MHFSCNTSDLLKGVLLISNLCQAKSTKQILQDVKIVVSEDEIQLLGTDLEVAVRYRLFNTDISQSGITAIPVLKLLNMIKEIKDPTVEVRCKEQFCYLTSNDAQFKLITDDPEEFPLIPDYDFNDCMEVPAGQFFKYSNKTLFSVAKEMSCYSYNGLLIEIYEDGIKLVATDGRRLAVAGNIEKERENLLSASVVPVKGIMQIIKSIDNVEENIMFKIYKNQFIIKTGNVEVASRLLEGDFPKYKDVIPKGNDKVLRLNVQELIAALRKASITAGNEVRAVQFTIESNSLTMFSQQEGIGESKVEIPLEYDGEKIEITFNPDYIMDYIKVVDSEEIVVKYKDDISSCLIEDNENEYYVVMPITAN